MNRKHISSTEHYKQYYINQALQKGGGPYFAGRLFQKGAGIGSIFASLFKRALPFLSSASSQIGKVALKTGANVLADTVSGQRFQDSLKNRLRESGRELKRNAINKLQSTLASQTGAGKKRRATSQSKERSKKRRKTVQNTTKQKKRKTAQQTAKQKKQKRSKAIKHRKGKNSVSSQKARKPRTYQDIFG